MSVDSTPRTRKHKTEKKKRRGFGISFFGKNRRKPQRKREVSSISDSSEESENRSISDSFDRLPVQSVFLPPTEQDTRQLTEDDLHLLREDLARQENEIHALKNVTAYLQKELEQSPARHATNCGELTRLSEQNHQMIESL